VDQPHHLSPAHARLESSEEVAQPLGWIGGKTLAAQSELPNMCQICDIDCTKLPSDVWGGLGPRTGRLVLYVGWTEGLTAMSCCRFRGHLVKLA
jgi:hypothetical protein